MQTLFEPLDADTHKLKTSVTNLNNTITILSESPDYN